MSAKRILLVLCCLAVNLGASRIYQTVDEHGNPVFTDVPPPDPSKGMVIDLSPSNTFDTPVATEAETPPALDEPVTGDYYKSLAIVSPAADETIRDNPGNLAIAAAIEPKLVTGHRLLLVFDEEPTEIEAEADSSFYITNVDRGTHTVAVRVVDRAGNMLKQSAPVTFHLQRISVQHPTTAPPPKPSA